MTNEVQVGSKVKASDINQLVKAANNPQIAVVGHGLRAASIGGAMTISQDAPLRGDANAALPQLFSIKAGPSKKWQHRDVSGKVYPSLYVYLGPSPALALETVNISDNLIADGDHPSIFLYFNLSKSANWKTRAYPIDPQTGEPSSTAFDPVPNSMENIRKCMIDSTDNSLDGWYELPTSPLNAMPIWAVCYVSFGATPVLAFCTVDEIKTGVQNSNSLSSVEMVAYEPDLSSLGYQSTFESGTMFLGMIGSPIKLYDLNPYSTDPLSAKFDADGKVKSGYNWITLYAANNGLTFQNTSDKASFSVKPCCMGVRSNGEDPHWKYWFYIMLPAAAKAPSVYGQVPFTAEEISSCIKVETIPERDGDVTLYTLPQIQKDGATTHFQIASLEGDNKTSIGQNVTVSSTTSEKTPLCAKGSVMGLFFQLDQTSAEWDMAKDGAVLFFMPVSMPHIINSPVYVPKIVKFGEATSSNPSVYPFLQISPMFRACTIFPSGSVGTMQYRNFGNVPQFAGESIYTKYGLLTPPYESASLLGMASPNNTDAQQGMKQSQFENIIGETPWNDPPGLTDNQFASIMWETKTDNISKDYGDTWESDPANPAQSYLQLYGFNRFDMDQKVNYSPVEAVQGIPSLGPVALRKDFDFVIRKRFETEQGDESEGANVGYMRGFVPDTILDDGIDKCRSIDFVDGMLKKDEVYHTGLTLYGFPFDEPETVTFNENCKKLSEGYGNIGDPKELNMVARYWHAGEQEINYVDLDLSWIVDSLTACIEGLGPYYPPSGGGGTQELGQVIDELSAKCDPISGDFWIRGEDHTINYGSSIGDSGKDATIDLDGKELKGSLWAVEENLEVHDSLTAANNVYAGNDITAVGDVEVGNDLRVGAAASVNGNLTVDGDTNFAGANSNTRVNNLHIDGSIYVGNDVYAPQTINIGGTNYTLLVKQ